MHTPGKQGRYSRGDKKESVLITGAGGLLGSELVDVFGGDYKVIPAGRADFDITDYEGAEQFIAKSSPDIIIHTAAFTDVDACERMPYRAFQVNVIGTRNIAAAAGDIGAKLVYISTDYVFDGSKETPYWEHDQTGPINVYGKTKLLGEQFVRELSNRFFIIRTAWLYGRKGKNFVRTVLSKAGEGNNLQVVDDQRGSPTHALDVARQIKVLAPTELYGTYHCTSSGSCSWYEFAVEVVKLARLEVKVEPVSSGKLSLPAMRPQYSVLDNRMLRSQELDIMPPWEEPLTRFVNTLLEETDA